jgi:hypothetical protein
MSLRSLVPAPLHPAARRVKHGIRCALNRLQGIENSPFGTDLVGYESLISRIKSLGIDQVPGDFVEIGAFLGGGSRKLAAFAKTLSPQRKLYVADVFDPDFDWTETAGGRAMAEVYKDFLGEFGTKSQHDVFKEVTRGMDNIVTLIGDSMHLWIPSAQLAFAFIDGNHDPLYVENDFRKVWPLIQSGGVVAFHDYGGNLPQTTAAIDKIGEEHRNEIREKIVEPAKTLAYFVKA